MSDMNEVHLGAVRKVMLEQLIALRAAKPGADLTEELKRSKGVSELSQTLINSARVEVDYLPLTDQGQSIFLDMPPGSHVARVGTTVQAGDRNGITSITKHRMR